MCACGPRKYTLVVSYALFWPRDIRLWTQFAHIIRVLNAYSFVAHACPRRHACRLWKVARTPDQIRQGMEADDGRGPGECVYNQCTQSPYTACLQASNLASVHRHVTSALNQSSKAVGKRSAGKGAYTHDLFHDLFTLACPFCLLAIFVCAHLCVCVCVCVYLCAYTSSLRICVLLCACM